MILLAWLLLALPAPPLIAGFRARGAARPAEARGLLLAAAASWAWLVIGVFFRDMIGPDYSDRRFATIETHLALVLALAVWAALRRGSLGRWPWLAALATALLWAYMLIVSSVV